MIKHENQTWAKTEKEKEKKNESGSIHFTNLTNFLKYNRQIFW